MIRGSKILLRTVREADLETLFALLSDLSTRGDHFPIDLPSESSFRKQFQENGFWAEGKGRLLICDHAGVIRGSIWFFTPAPYYDAFEIGYHLFDVESRGKGYTTEALSLLVTFLFGTRKINRLQLTVVVGNAASRRVAEKCGFQSEGRVRGAIFLRGENHDLEMFSLLRQEAAG